jgi:protease I
MKNNFSFGKDLQIMADKKIAIFLEKLFEDLEFWYPKLRMLEAGNEVKVIAPMLQTYTGKSGLKAEADITIAEVKTEDFDALIIPGGYAPDHMRRNVEMISFTRQMYASCKIIAAICHGPWMLASAGVAKDRLVTSFFAIKDDLVNAGADWVDQAVVKDENLITSRTPDDLPVFCRTIIDNLDKQP